jgi:hypothetical protein
LRETNLASSAVPNIAAPFPALGHHQLSAFQENIKSLLGDTNINDKFRMPVYFAAGETDIALLNSQRTLAVFNNYGVRTFWVMSSNGHEWLNWRRYLYQTAQIMFLDDH